MAHLLYVYFVMNKKMKKKFKNKATDPNISLSVSVAKLRFCKTGYYLYVSHFMMLSLTFWG